MLCVSIFIIGALVGFEDLGSVCLAADHVIWQGQGATSIEHAAVA
jgi:hypothetical protein